MKRKKTIELEDNEKPAIINLESGELTLIKEYHNNLPEGKSVFEISSFTKLNTEAITVMKELLTKDECFIVLQMIQMAEFNTNSLRPLNDDTTQKELSELFEVGKNQIQKYIKHLFDIGVFAQFKISKYGLKEYWILNPYISFKGKTIEDTIFKNFSNTIITDKILKKPISLEKLVIINSYKVLNTDKKYKKAKE